jgi:hypothetical protein
MTPARIASEYELSLDESIGGQVLPLEPWQTGDYPYDPALPLVVGSWDFGMGDLTVNGLWQPSPEYDTLFDCVFGNNRKAAHYDSEIRALPYPKAEREWADPSGSARNSSGGSWISDLRGCGREIRGIEPLTFEENGKLVTRRDKVREVEFIRGKLLPRLRINTSTVGGRVCAEALSEWKFPTDESDRPTSYIPVHNESSHFGDMVIYYGIGEHGNATFNFDRFSKTAAVDEARFDWRAFERREESDDRRIWNEP